MAKHDKRSVASESLIFVALFLGSLVALNVIGLFTGLGRFDMT